MTEKTPTIDLRLFATFASRSPANASRYPIASGMTVAQLIDTLEIPAAEVKLIFINGVRVQPDAQVHGGERVGLFPPVGGG